ncbi:MAG TPA: endonuclease/exonuclease/phosphatase family protein [Candidatus Limnocylindrales bacterium]
MESIHVATLNIRNLADRWDERLPLLLADMAALQPDLLGLQEVVYPLQQDRLIGAAGAGHYIALRAWAGRSEYGNALLVRSSLESVAIDRLDLGNARSALNAAVQLPGGGRIAIVVTHLHHKALEEGIRDEQARLLLDWIDPGSAGNESSGTPQVVVGDFNAGPDEPAYRRMRAAGFRSAYLEANGAEPAVTWPSGLEAPGKDTDGEPDCLDYVWVRGPLEVESAGLAFDRPAVADSTLYPSDHLGLSARLRLIEG